MLNKLFTVNCPLDSNFDKMLLRKIPFLNRKYRPTYQNMLGVFKEPWIFCQAKVYVMTISRNEGKKQYWKKKSQFCFTAFFIYLLISRFHSHLPTVEPPYYWFQTWSNKVQSHNFWLKLLFIPVCIISLIALSISCFGLFAAHFCLPTFFLPVRF